MCYRFYLAFFSAETLKNFWEKVEFRVFPASHYCKAAQTLFLGSLAVGESFRNSVEDILGDEDLFYCCLAFFNRKTCLKNVFWPLGFFKPHKVSPTHFAWTVKKSNSQFWNCILEIAFRVLGLLLYNTQLRYKINSRKFVRKCYFSSENPVFEEIFWHKYFCKIEAANFEVSIVFSI